MDNPAESSGNGEDNDFLVFKTSRACAFITIIQMWHLIFCACRSVQNFGLFMILTRQIQQVQDCAVQL